LFLYWKLIYTFKHEYNTSLGEIWQNKRVFSWFLCVQFVSQDHYFLHVSISELHAIYMKTHLEHKFLSVRRYTSLFIWPYVTFYYACAKSVRGKMSADGKPARCRTIISTESAKKVNMKEICYTIKSYNINNINNNEIIIKPL
jgi:hypothetical protein